MPAVWCDSQSVLHIKHKNINGLFALQDMLPEFLFLCQQKVFRIGMPSGILKIAQSIKYFRFLYLHSSKSMLWCIYSS
jgi:hypothetical protein